jgi:hypothetical protein
VKDRSARSDPGRAARDSCSGRPGWTRSALGKADLRCSPSLKSANRASNGKAMPPA